MSSLLSRREFLAATSGAALAGIDPQLAPAQSNKSLSSTHHGKLQVNLWIPSLFADFPLIDIFKLSDRFWEVPGAKEDFYELIGENGYPTRMANGASFYQTYCIGYLTANDNWVITWEGAGSVTIGGPTAGVSYALVSKASNRLEYSITSSALAFGTGFRLIVRITGITRPISNIRIFRKSHEPLLSAGQKFNPDFLALYRGMGRIRFMDWMYTNVNPIARWQDRTTEQSWNWLGYNFHPASYAGTCTRSGSSYRSAHAISGNPAKWVNGQMIQCVLPSPPVFVSITAFANGPNPTITAQGHELQTGDVVSFHSMPGSFLAPTPTFPNQTEGKFFTISVIDADNFVVNGLDSSKWGAYTGGGFVAKQVTLSVGALPTKPVLSNVLGSVGRITLTSNAGSLFTLVYDEIADGLSLAVGPTAAGVPFGLSVETLVDLANELKASPWFCVPTYADDDFVRQFATYVKNRLDPELVASFEYSNEVWNVGWGLIPTGACQQRAQRLWGILGIDGYNNYYGFRVARIMSIVSDVFAGQMHRVNRVMSVFTAAPGGGQKVSRFQAPAARLDHSPTSFIDSIAIAPYLESNRANTANTEFVAAYKAGGAAAESALQWLDNKLRTNNGDKGSAFTLDYCTSVLFPAWKAIANSPAPGTGSKKLCMYEGGWGYIPRLEKLFGPNPYGGVTISEADVLGFFSGYYASKYFAQTLSAYLEAFTRAGGEYPSQYCLVGGWGAGGMWGVIAPNMYATRTPAYFVLADFNSQT
ncbi:MAG: hypothetical protein HY852_16400 [Bradyrhizobium sp.]|uniref:hypothetical protein n=1 Tax=Bradyrhizobium sp. TaxID=376 RepID=UPI0025BDA4D7|nr:hypothetical protein [Bradyrhizobium sp.]MBI5263391.1 hypothetical protein [Bradyrhizobium sp.]